MRRYLDNSILIDLMFCLGLGIIIHLFRPFLKEHVNLPAFDSVIKSMDAVVKVATPLIGFMLTIVGVIVTFKNNFDSQKTNKEDSKDKISDPSIPPANTIFDQPLQKKEILYGTDLHKKVMLVFLSAVYELTGVVFLFLAIQSGFICFSRFYAALLTSLGFFIVVIALVRSLY
ncbi:MAG: hypothetical protein ACXVDW_20430, partial [Bacteroidia bacterium]